MINILTKQLLVKIISRFIIFSNENGLKNESLKSFCFGSLLFEYIILKCILNI